MARNEFLSDVIPISLIPSFFICFTKSTVSEFDPLFDKQIITSFFVATPMSPCKASEPCKKTDGVPVEFKVAEIFIPIIALLPIPVIMTLPLIFDI